MPNNDFKERHLTPHRRKMIEVFVACTRGIIEREGEKAVTIKKIGDCTTLNPATIYNYFENVDHLLYFSKLNVLDDFHNDLSNVVREGDDPLVVYKRVWLSFAKHSFSKAKEFIEIFFSQIAMENPHYLSQYLQIFPVVNEGFPAYLEKVLVAETLPQGLDLLIEVAKYVGYFNNETAKKLNDMSFYIYEGILRRVADGSLTEDEGYADFSEYLEISINALKLK